MEIPNSLISIACHNGLHRGPLIYPEYVVPVLRKVYKDMLDVTAVGKGISIEPFPDNGDPSMRYREVFSVDQELGWMRKLYGHVNGSYHADNAWTEQTLKTEMERLLMAEHERLKNAAKPKVLAVANPTFLAFGLTEDQSRSMQAAGFADRASCIGQSIVDLASIHKISIELAGRLAQPDAKAEAKK